MRIAYFTSAYPRATDTFIQREIAELRRLGVEVLTFAIRQPEAANNVSEGILAERKNTSYLLPFNLFNLLSLNIKKLLTAPSTYFKALKLALTTAKPGLRGTIYQLFYFQEALLLANLLIKNKVQHVHNHFGDSSGSVTMLAAALSGIGYSMTIHGPHIFFEPTYSALREKVKYSKFIVCISNYCRSQMMLFSDQDDWEKLEIVHCGIDLDTYLVTDRTTNLGTDLPPAKLLYVGRLAAEKGVPVLLRSLSLLKEEGYNFELTLLGDGPDRTLLESLVKEHELGSMVHFGGYASQQSVRDTLLSSDIFILPSFAEGVPVSLMEAMACGIPVVGTNVGGVTELIKNGVSGMVVAPSDEIALKNAIAAYLTNPELRNQARIAGREAVEAEFNLKTEAKKLSQLFSRPQD